MSQAAGRAPARFDVRAPYPRLVAKVTAESALWRAQTDLILDAAGEGIYGLDLNGCCAFVNPAAARMTGHSVEELLDQPMHNVVHHSHGNGDEYPRTDCPIYAAFKDGMIRNVVDEVFWRKDGSSFPVEYTSTPIFNGSELMGAVVVFRDISLRAQTEDRLRRALSEVQQLKERLQLENTSLRQEIESARGFWEIVGNSSVLRETLQLVRRIAATDSTVLIQGETGTGKELIAQAIHRLSPRAHAPMVRVNCGAICAQLADSELFGHEKGAFTGALVKRAGRFEQAFGGTLFLDEVGELPLETQAKLLRVLQEREFERVGGNTTLCADVRVVAATNRDLKTLVKQGSFRADLFFRLNVVPVHVPSLQSRASDIPALTDQFLRRLEVRQGRRLGNVSREGLDRLARYGWPGNVRELQNVLERAAVLSDGEEVVIPEELLSPDDDSAAEAPLDAAHVAGPADTSDPPPPLEARANNALALDEVERKHILQVLAMTRWRVSGPSGASSMLLLHAASGNTLESAATKVLFPTASVGIARAFAIEPQILLMDEPFGALDALTRGTIQDELIAICAETGQTVFMITHDVDEAIYLSDRILLMSNGPDARIAEQVSVDLPRPRRRSALAKQPEFYALRTQLMDFLVERAGQRPSAQLPVAPAAAQTDEQLPSDATLASLHEATSGDGA
jgi:PAS domain S-box-containing protein